MWMILEMDKVACSNENIEETHLIMLKPSKRSDKCFNPIRAGGGGWISLYFFQMAISPWKKGSGGPKFRDFS